MLALAMTLPIDLLLGEGWVPDRLSLAKRTILLAFTGLVVFGILETRPRRLPRRLPRWVLQVVSVAFAMPLATLAIYVVLTPPGAPPFWQHPDRLEGFTYLTLLSLLIAPWGALGGLVRQKEAAAENQALAFALERSELERQALDARFRLMQAQVAPHFLFNTLANVQALVEAGSPRAPEVLRHLTAYLRAAVPRLGDEMATVRDELELTRAYLELMHMRMPDRLRYDLRVDDAALAVRCPRMTLLTLVENAVRHGIDPAEEGGEIRIDVRRNGGRCLLRVHDTGVGPQGAIDGTGTGIAMLRERLHAAFRGTASLRVTPVEPHGLEAEVDLPVDGPAAS